MPAWTKAKRPSSRKQSSSYRDARASSYWRCGVAASTEKGRTGESSSWLAPRLEAGLFWMEIVSAKASSGGVHQGRVGTLVVGWRDAPAVRG